MRFLCDQMLVRLGRWLRAAGYDTEIVETSCSDKEIFQKAQCEGRLLITRDRHFLEFNDAAEVVVWLKANRLKECIQELNAQLKINWTKAPFSRCLVCNEKLSDAKPDDVKQAPLSVQQRCQRFWVCPQCKKVYWEGSHTKRMLKTLQSWHC